MPQRRRRREFICFSCRRVGSVFVCRRCRRRRRGNTGNGGNRGNRSTTMSRRRR